MFYVYQSTIISKIVKIFMFGYTQCGEFYLKLLASYVPYKREKASFFMSSRMLCDFFLSLTIGNFLKERDCETQKL